MKFSQIDFPALVFTYSVFGTAGFFACKQVKQAAGAYTLVLVIIAAFFARWIGTSVRLISVFGSSVYLNWVLQALLLGVLLRLLVRRRYPFRW